MLNLVRSARNRLRPVWITFGIVFSVFPNTQRFLTSFSILFNFQGPVAPQPCGWRPVYFTTEVVFCQALFFRSFWTFWTWTLKKLLRTNWNFSASIGSFQGLPAEASEVILLPQRLALKYNTTPPPPCQHFLTDFFHSFLRAPQNSSRPQEKLRRSCFGAAWHKCLFSLLI